MDTLRSGLGGEQHWKFAFLLRLLHKQDLGFLGLGGRFARALFLKPISNRMND